MATVLDLGKVFKGPNEELYFYKTDFFYFPRPIGYRVKGTAFKLSKPHLMITHEILAGEAGPMFKVSVQTHNLSGNLV